MQRLSQVNRYKTRVNNNLIAIHLTIGIHSKTKIKPAIFLTHTDMPSPELLRILAAIVLTSVINLLIMFLAIALSNGIFSPFPLSPIFYWTIYGIGIVQLLYILPLIFWLYRQQQYAWMKGFIIGAILTALFNGGCYLLLTGAFRQRDFKGAIAPLKSLTHAQGGNSKTLSPPCEIP
jgi:hypothetical protein